jgi:hypothetical protein
MMIELLRNNTAITQPWDTEWHKVVLFPGGDMMKKILFYDETDFIFMMKKML